MNERSKFEDWTEKYRPTSLDGLALEDETRQRFETYCDRGTMPHLLLHGPRGTGKTSAAHILAERVGDAPPKRLAFDDDRGIDAIRSEVVPYLRAGFGVRVLVLDQAGRLTRDAQEALLRPIEKYNDINRVVAVVNEEGDRRDRLVAMFVDRLKGIHMPPPPVPERARVLRRVLEAEGLSAEEEVVESYARDHTSLRTMLMNAQDDFRVFGGLQEEERQEPVPKQVRKVVEAVRTINQGKTTQGAKSVEISGEVGYSEAWVSRWTGRAEEAGYLDNQGSERGSKSWIAVRSLPGKGGDLN